jgi:hypothetical protein
MCAVSHVASHLDIVICKLAQLSIIRAKLFLLGRDTQRQTGDEVENEKQKAGKYKGPGEAGQSASNLVAQLDPVAVNPADGVVLCTVKRGDGFTIAS